MQLSMQRAGELALRLARLLAVLAEDPNSIPSTQAAVYN